MHEGVGSNVFFAQYTWKGIKYATQTPYIQFDTSASSFAVTESLSRHLSLSSQKLQLSVGIDVDDASREIFARRILMLGAYMRISQWNLN